MSEEQAFRVGLLCDDHLHRQLHPTPQRVVQALGGLHEESLRRSSGYVRTQSLSVGVKNGTLFDGLKLTSLSDFPSFDIQFSGVLLHLSRYQYFIRTAASVDEWTLGILPTEDVMMRVAAEE